MEAITCSGFRGHARSASIALALLCLTSNLAAVAENKDEAAAKEAADLKEQIAGQEAVAAVWKVHEVDFVYRSSVAVYDCGALQDRVASIMRGVGARDDVNVRVSNCDAFNMGNTNPSTSYPTNSRSGNGGNGGGFDVTGSANRGSQFDRFGTRSDSRGPSQTAYVRIRAMLPTEVTPDIIKELDRDKSRRELISKVTGNPAAGMNDAVVFPAKRQVVTLDRKTAGLEPAECELLEQMSSGIFRQLGMKVVRSSSGCSRNSVSHIPPRMAVESLMYAPVGATSIPLTAPAEEPATTPPGAGSASPPETQAPPSPPK